MRITAVVLSCPSLRASRACRGFSTKSAADYIEEWQKETVKSTAFYEQHANGRPKRYFYSIDLQGRIFLEETLPKNLATSMKNEAFLDFFCARIQETTAKDRTLLLDAADDYPYVSLCGVERNYIRPADSVIVFHSLQEDHLVFGATLRQPFQPNQLAISQRTGRLYHKLVDSNLTPLHKQQQQQQQQQQGTARYGLIKSSVAVSLSERMVPEDGPTDLDDWSRMTYLDEDNQSHLIPWLPDKSEPGPWAMPLQEADNDSSE